MKYGNGMDVCLIPTSEFWVVDTKTDDVVGPFRKVSLARTYITNNVDKQNRINFIINEVRCEKSYLTSHPYKD